MSENWTKSSGDAALRGDDVQQGSLFSYKSIEDRIPADHSIRKLREYADIALQRIRPHLDAIYSKEGRPSVPPERLLRALLLQVMFSIRSERQLMEQLDYNLMFRWFVGLGMDDNVWSPTVFTKNRERLFNGDIAEHFFDEVLRLAQDRNLVSSEHFTVDGSLIQAWAGQKSFQPKTSSDDDQQNPPPTGGGGGNGRKGRNEASDFRGQKRCNETHQSTTDPDARLFKKGGDGAKLVYMAHLLTENRNGLVVNTRVSHATGKAETEAALEMVSEVPGTNRITLGADKGYDQRVFVQILREFFATPHIAQNNTGRRSNIDGRTTVHAGYQQSQKKRKRVEEVFGWLKTIAGFRQIKHRGLAKVRWLFAFATAVYNLVRIKNLALSAK